MIDLEKGEGGQHITSHPESTTTSTTINTNNFPLESSKKDEDRKKKGSQIKKKSPKTHIQATQFSTYNVEKSESEKSDEEPDRYITQTDRRQQYEFERFLKNTN